jgi:hypothetical protein
VHTALSFQIKNGFLKQLERDHTGSWGKLELSLQF